MGFHPALSPLQPLGGFPQEVCVCTEQEGPSSRGEATPSQGVYAEGSWGRGQHVGCEQHHVWLAGTSAGGLGSPLCRL